jgi:Methyltransferase domain
MVNGLWPQTGYVLRASGVMARHPGAAAERIRGRFDRSRDQHAMRASGLSTDELYPIDQNWARNLHAALGSSWPCTCEADADALYSEIMADFRARGFPEQYAGWCDGGHTFTTASWALVTHLQPRTVVETGVARGVTSRFVLEGLERTGFGRLWSVDLPTVDPQFHPQIAAAVPEQLRERWTFVSGTSRQRLPALVADAGGIDLFIHDSLHTGSNLRFELECAWEAVRPGAAVLVDDVYQNLVFHQFVEKVRPTWSTVAANPDGSYRFGILLKGHDEDSTHGGARSTIAATES